MRLTTAINVNYCQAQKTTK